MNPACPTPFPEPALDMEVLRQFRVIFRSVRKHFQLIEDRVGLSGTLLWALAVIDEQPGIRLTRLARSMSVHQSTASNILAKLIELQLVRKERNRDDNRVTGLFVTEQGRKRLEQAPGPVRGLLPDALGKLPDHVLTELHDNLQRLLEQMETLETQGCTIPLADI
jgi:DNA-binding MarR family transcriptional regulator